MSLRDRFARKNLKAKETLRIRAELGHDVTQQYRQLCGEPVPPDLPDFLNVYCPSEYGRGLLAIRETDTNTFREMTHELHMAGRWAECGFNVFDLSELAAGFLLTNPPEVPKGGLKLPYDCFCIRIPQGVVPIFDEGEQKWASLLWVHQFRHVHRTFGRVGFIRIQAEHQGLQVYRDRYPSELGAEDDEMPIYEGVIGSPAYEDEDNLTPRAAIHVVRNFISWLEAYPENLKVKPEKRRKKKGRKAKKIEDSGAYPRVYLMGSKVKLRPELKRAASEIALGSSKKHHVEGWDLRTRHTVRGHWKQQAYGEGNALRKLKWIQPYWRGPEGAAVWAHIYSGDTVDE